MQAAEGPLGALRQIQVRFDPEQDRLVLRINTTGAAELQCWLTRRMLRRLWPHLEKALTTNPVVASQATPAAREAVKQFQREGALQGTDFSKPFDDTAEKKPLGDEPILVCRAKLGRDGRHHRLWLAPKQGDGLNLRITDEILHSLCELIRRALAKSDWDLDLGSSVDSPAAAPQERM